MSKTLMHVAWMAILLGIVTEAAILLVSTVFARSLALKPVLADVLQKVSWSFIVCMGLALARGATRMMMLEKAVAITGIVGLLSAPLAFAVARSLHEGIQEVLFIKVYQGSGGSPILLALIKGIEYGTLGAVLSWVAGQAWGKAKAHALVGLAAGLIFGAAMILVLLADASQPPTAGTLISRALNEIINPVGCSLTLYAAEVMGRPATGAEASA